MGRPFQPGHPGNGGRPPSLMSYVRQKIGEDGRVVINFLVDVVNGKPIKGRIPRLTDRVDAARVLLERGFGRVPLADGEGPGPQIIEIILKPGQDY